MTDQSDVAASYSSTETMALSGPEAEGKHRQREDNLVNNRLEGGRSYRRWKVEGSHFGWVELGWLMVVLGWCQLAEGSMGKGTLGKWWRPGRRGVERERRGRRKWV